MITGHILVPNLKKLWALAQSVEALLGELNELIAIGEHATDAVMTSWVAFSRDAWHQGRLFGTQGELCWRRYGTHWRAVLTLDTIPTGTSTGTSTDLHETMSTQGFQGILQSDHSAADQTLNDQEIHLWPHGAYSHVTVRYYKDSAGNEFCYRYLRATPISLPQAAAQNATQEVPHAT